MKNTETIVFQNLYQYFNLKEDEIIEGFNILYDKVGVKRRKKLPASEYLIKMFERPNELFRINRCNH